MAAACPFPSPQGSQVFIRQLAESLAGRGHSVYIVSYHFGDKDNMAGVPVLRIPPLIPYRKMRAGPSWRKPVLDFLLAAKLAAVVRKYKIDIIHAHNYEAALAGALARLFTARPVVFHTHNVMTDELCTYFSGGCSRWLARRAAGVIDYVTPRIVDHIVAITPEIKSFFLSRGIGGQKISHIPPGAPIGDCCNEAAPVADDPRTQESGPVPSVLYSGNIDNYQNLPFLLRSFVEVIKSVPEAQLLIVSHADTGGLGGLCRQLGIADHVQLVPHADFLQMQQYLRAARIAVLPRVSWSGFPIKLLNYMAAGKAVVACRSSAKGLEHEKEGIIAADGDRDGFSRAIIRLLTDDALCAQLGRNARIKARTVYHPDRIARQFEALYGRLTSGNKEGRQCRGS